MSTISKSMTTSVLAASLLVMSSIMSVSVQAQTADKAVTDARNEYRNASKKISTDYRAKTGTCAKMTGTERSVCQIDARAARTKAVADARAARDKVYVRSNFMTDADFVVENGGED